MVHFLIKETLKNQKHKPKIYSFFEACLIEKHHQNR